MQFRHFPTAMVFRGKLNPPALRDLLYLYERDEALPLIGRGGAR
jgi:hypothetical protein